MTFTKAFFWGWVKSNPMRVCCREEPILTPCWNCFFDLLSLLLLLQSYTMACLKGPCPSAWLLKCLCSVHREIIWPCPFVSGCKKEEINTPLPKAGPSWRCFARLKTLFTLLPHCLFLSTLPFDFSSLLFFSHSMKEPGIQIPARWLLWDTGLPSFGQPALQIKSYSLTQHLISQIHWPVMWQAERMDLVTLGGPPVLWRAGLWPCFEDSSDSNLVLLPCMFASNVHSCQS